MNQYRNLIALVDAKQPMPIEINIEHLGELLYTAEETGLIDFQVNPALALLIYKVVEAASRTTDEEIKTIKM